MKTKFVVKLLGIPPQTKNLADLIHDIVTAIEDCAGLSHGSDGEIEVLFPQDTYELRYVRNILVEIQPLSPGTVLLKDRLISIVQKVGNVVSLFMAKEVPVGRDVVVYLLPLPLYLGCFSAVSVTSQKG